MSIRDRVIEKINKEVGKDLKNLHKAEIVIEQYKKRFEEIEKKLNINEKETISTIKNALNNEKQIKEVIEIENDKIERFNKNLESKITNYENILENVNPFYKNIKYLENSVEYLRIIEDIQEINSNLTLGIKNNKDDTKIIDYYLSLYGESDSNNSIIGRLQNINAKYLKDFAIKSSIYWYKILIKKFSNDFEIILKNIKWSQQGQVLDEFKPSREQIDKLITLAEYIFLIKTPIENDNYNNCIKITPSIICPGLSIVTTLLIKPFRQKFFYHFNGLRQTNRLDKPEWYLTQTLNWAKDKHLFVGKTFQLSVIKSGHKNLNIRLEFIRGLVQLCIEKLVNDIEEISKDCNLFSHLIDEILSFESELKDNLDYPNSLPSVINVLTQPKYLLKWISIEEKFCTNQMDLLLQSDNPWIYIEPTNTEELKIPKCADQFIRLLDAIKERYNILTQPGHKLQFLNLQLELIDNYRRRLVQLHGIGTIDSIKTLNTINYIISVLNEWGENIHYLHIHAALINLNSNEINSVFEQPIKELKHWKCQLLKDLSSKIVDEIKAKSMSYRFENWNIMRELNTNELFMLTQSAGEMFQLMVTTFHNLEKELSLNLFHKLLRMIASNLDEFFLYSLIMNSKFSIGGAAQFQYDMIRNLFPIFGQYITHSNLLFKKIHDSCILLNIPQGNALLLYQTLKNDIPIEEKTKTLHELGILCLDPELSLDILERRVNLRVY